MEALLTRFLRYVRFDTQSDDNSTTTPSSLKQFELLHHLKHELIEMKLSNVTLSEHGVLMATLPATPGCEKKMKVGFLAHVDTSPESSGANVNPIVHQHYNGKDLKLSNGETIRVADFPNLKKMRGHTVITTDGTTLLGADNKAGIAIIMEAVTHLLQHPEIKHGEIKIGFTPDEEVGRGVDHFDVKAFGAECAYTIDGAELGEVEGENFNAYGATVTVQGFNTHPGTAKNRMVNASRLLSQIIAKLPLSESPERTEKYQGFFHPIHTEGDVNLAKCKMIIRDFTDSGMKKKIVLLKKFCKEIESKNKSSKVTVEFKEQYRNMKRVLAKKPYVLKNAIKAIKAAGVEPLVCPIRGGTDGARLSFMGLPTPNIFTGGQNYHSTKEFASLEWMAKSKEVVIELAKIYAK